MLFSTIDEITPISNCGVIQGRRTPAYSELSQLAPLDGSISYADGKYTLTATSGGRYVVVSSGADLSKVTRVEDTVPLVGDFDIMCRADLTATTDMICMLYARVNNDTFIAVSDNSESGSTQIARWIDGVRTFYGGPSIPAYGTPIFRMLRRLNKFTVYTSTDNGLTFTDIGSSFIWNVEEPMYMGFLIDDVSPDVASVDFFKVYKGCDTNQVEAKSGLIFFDSEKVYGTGIDDGTTYDTTGKVSLTDNGHLRILGPTSRVAMNTTGNDVVNLPRFEPAMTVSGDFIIEACVDAGVARPNYAMFCLGVTYGSTQDYVMTWLTVGDSPSSYGEYVVAGTRTSTGSNITGVNVDGLCRVRLVRVGDLFTFYVSLDSYNWADSLSTGSFTYAFPADGQPFIGVDWGNAQHELYIKSMHVVSGTDTKGELLIHSDGEYCLEATAGYGWDRSTIDDAVIEDMTTMYQFAEYEDPQSFTDPQDLDTRVGWNGLWLTKATLQGLANSGDKCLYLKAQLTPSDNLSAYASLTADQYKVDLVAPYPITEPVAFFHEDTAPTIDIPLKLKNGYDDGPADYVGYSRGRYNDGVWEYEQLDGSWSVTEGDYTTVLVHPGEPLTEDLSWVPNQPDTVTRLRLTAWDSAGNHSDRVDVTLVPMSDPDYPDRENVLTTDTVNGEAGLYVAPDPANVRKTVPVGQTVGTLRVPVVSPSDVRAGVEY